MKNKLSQTIRNFLCDAVNIDRKFDFEQKDWYFKHSWSDDQEFEFANRLLDHVFENKKIYKGEIPFLNNKKMLKKQIYNSTVLSGWKYSDPDINKRKIQSFV
jgi:hypothetical protein